MSSWFFEPLWQELPSGEPEEKAAFARLGICAHEQWLTEFQNLETNTVATHPCLSAYHLAEWLAWNWWRLRWEGRSVEQSVFEWQLSHQVSSVGGGYIWPNITMFSDGQRIVVSSKPTKKQPTSSMRYLADVTAILPANDWESGVQHFIETVIARLHSQSIVNSNLEQVWDSVCEEQASLAETHYRKLEAMLGYDPDEAPEELIHQLLEAQDHLGMGAVDELAAHHWKSAVPTYEEIKKAIGSAGSASDERSRVKIKQHFVPSQNKPAWVLGKELAAEVRGQLNPSANNLTNEQLADLVGVLPQVLDGSAVNKLPVSMALKLKHNERIISLTGGWLTGRRFELARLLADMLVYKEDALSSVTRSYTYRQKFQRAFAAELLCPFELLKADMDSDYSDENQMAMAEKYEISPLAIKTILINNSEIERDDDSWFQTA